MRIVYATGKETIESLVALFDVFSSLLDVESTLGCLNLVSRSSDGRPRLKFCASVGFAREVNDEGEEIKPQGIEADELDRAMKESRIVSIEGSIGIRFEEGLDRQPLQERTDEGSKAMLDGTGIFEKGIHRLVVQSKRPHELGLLAGWTTNRRKQGLPAVQEWDLYGRAETSTDLQTFLDAAQDNMTRLRVIASLDWTTPAGTFSLDAILSEIDWSVCTRMDDLTLDVYLPKRYSPIVTHRPGAITYEESTRIADSPYIPRSQCQRPPLDLSYCRLKIYDQDRPHLTILPSRLPHTPTLVHALTQLFGIYCEYEISFFESFDGDTFDFDSNYAAQLYDTLVKHEVGLLRDRDHEPPGWSWSRR